jgi:hypothetical protein
MSGILDRLLAGIRDEADLVTSGATDAQEERQSSPVDISSILFNLAQNPGAGAVQGLEAITGTQVPRLNMERVFAGSSEEEDRKANTKYLQAHTRAMETQQRMRDAQEQEMLSRLSMLKNASKGAKDVFVAKGSKVKGTSDIDSGSFSKSQAPVVDQMAIKDLASSGMSQSKASRMVDTLGPSAAKRAALEAESASPEGGKASLKDLIEGLANSSTTSKEFLEGLKLLGILSK